MVDATKTPSSITTLQDEISRLQQAMEDLRQCETASVSLVHCPSASVEKRFVRETSRAMGQKKCVTATVSMSEIGLESPDELVRCIITELIPPGDTRPRGLLTHLDQYYERHRAQSREHFEEACRANEAEGDLTSLCASYLGSDVTDPTPELRAYQAWCEGTLPPRKYRNPNVRRALTERTAQRVLSELARIVLALGHRGLALFLHEGHFLAKRTERRREKAYTVLREMVDNFDGAGGVVATRVILSGQSPLFEGEKSIRSVIPLRMRLEIPSGAKPAPPHRSWTELDQKAPSHRHRRVASTESRSSLLRNLVRISEGVPPTQGVTRMSVGQDRIDRTVANLFRTVKRAGGFFSVLVGDYGSGKTHLMMHLAERALEDQRPVFWLNLERTNLDLGNPARHLRRFLEHSQLPTRGQPNALTLASRWTRSRAKTAVLLESLTTIAKGDNEGAIAARKALHIGSHANNVGFALENYLTGVDLETRPASPSYRREAYRRVFLWFALLAEQEQIRGPMVMIDEAENLYSSGLPPASRRTALRSLSFYCTGALPHTCVVMAMTPPAFEALKSEARDLLTQAGDMDSTLDWENVEKFRRSLWGLKPEPVRALTGPERKELCDRIRRMHRAVRGPLEVPDWDERIALLSSTHKSPRTLVRALIDQMESQWWSGR